MPVRFAVAAGARLLFSISTLVKTPLWQGFSYFPFTSNAWGWLKLALSALPVHFIGQCRRDRGIMLLRHSCGGAGGEGWWGGAYSFSSDFRNTHVNVPLQCQFFRRVRENLSVCLSPSLVGWWCLFNLPRNNLMNPRPSVWIQSFLAATVSPFKHLWAF